MLSELRTIEANYGEDRAKDVIRAIHFLQRHQFIYAGDRGTATIYNVVSDNRFERFIRSYFDAAGYRLVGNEREQWVGIIPDTDDVPLPRMRIDETVALLVLTLFWQEEVNAGNVEDRATVVTTVNTLFDRYEDIVSRNRKTGVSASRFFELMKEFARRSLVELRAFDSEEQDQEIVIRPQIRVLAGDDVLARIERFIQDEELTSGIAWPADDEPLEDLTEDDARKERREDREEEAVAEEAPDGASGEMKTAADDEDRIQNKAA